MSSSGNRNDDPGPSQQGPSQLGPSQQGPSQQGPSQLGPSSEPDQYEAHYHSLFCEQGSRQEQRGWGEDVDNSDAEYLRSDDNEVEEEVGGEETTDSGAPGGATQTSSEAKRKRLRRPNKVSTAREAFTAVDPTSGLPIEPKYLVKGYGIQLGAIAREVLNLNETDIREKSKGHLRVLLLQRLHARYEFPEEYNNMEEIKNPVNTQALGKFTKALSSYKTMVRAMLKVNKTFEQIQGRFPRISEEDFEIFLNNEELESTKAASGWGLDMRGRNIGDHRLGSRGYEGKVPKWDEEDKAYVAAGSEYKHEPTKFFLRSRYAKRTRTGELVTKRTPVADLVLEAPEKVKDLERAIVSIY